MESIMYPWSFWCQSTSFVISLLVGAAMINSDGAAALVLMSGEKALKLGLQVIAKIRGYADAAQVV